jgi:DNA integrity scanning protein DisA with diadenylate cyclase activity
MSIFDRHSPGHDGAMVIENGEVSSFGVYLPLSKTDKLSKAFGTRHRAAMGLSEVTDALVIVVSEERGNVIIFSKGRVQPAKDDSEVVSKIVSHWETTASYPLSKQKGKKQWVMVSEMAVCLILAFLFSSVVAPLQSEIREMGFTVPVEYILSPQKDITPVGEGPKSVELRLAGLASELYKIEPSRLRVQIDLSQKELGKHTVHITENQIQGLPAGVRLRDVNPSSIILSLKKLKEQEVMVKGNLVGTLPEGLEIVSVEVNPQKVRILSTVADRKHGEITLMTTPIYLQNIKESTSLSCKVIAPPGTQPADQQWPDITVKINIRDKSLLSIDLGGQNNLELYFNGNQLTDSLRRRFRYGGIPLSESATIAKQKKDDTWLITDRDRKRTYWVRKEGDKLNIYSSRFKVD